MHNLKKDKVLLFHYKRSLLTIFKLNRINIFDKLNNFTVKER